MGIYYSKNYLDHPKNSESSVFTSYESEKDVYHGISHDYDKKIRMSLTGELNLDDREKKKYIVMCYEDLMTIKNSEFQFKFIMDALDLMTKDQLSKRSTQIDLYEMDNYQNKLKYKHAIINLVYRRVYNNITKTPTGKDIYNYFIEQGIITDSVKEYLKKNKTYSIFEFSQWIWEHKVTKNV